MFKPWMTYVEEPDHFVTINLYHLLAATIPSKEILEQYENAIEKINEARNEKQDNIIQASTKEVKDQITVKHDSESDNVLKFNFVDKTKLH